VKTILLADDSITIQKVVELTFSDGDYRVFCVGNGALALRKIADVRPDVVLLDVIMPEKNGYEVCEAIKADPATSHIPVLLLCGTFEPFDARRADAAGASGHLTKPFESHALVARVEELMTARILRPGSASPSRVVIEEESPEDMPAEVFDPAAASPAAAGPAAGMTSAAAFEAPRPVPAMPAEPSRPVASPFAASPEAAEGGAYLGFADLAVGEGEEMVVPDRYDDTPPVPPAAAIEGFVPGHGFQDEPPRAAAEGANLSDAALDKLADLVVQKMTDRVVREIAWEILPGVAESVVRQRIKELEDRGR
jgi:CheY-like chemotaxis protein